MKLPMPWLRNIHWKTILLNPWFLAIAVIKLSVGTILGSDYLVDGFIPFVNYFATQGGFHAYDYFLSIGHPESFPYPPLMLLLLGVVRWVFSPVLSGDWQVVTLAHLFVMRLPMFIADLGLYIILCKWLETKERSVLWLYWASPVLFFITYIHGQLDVIPMAILFAALVMLFNKHPNKAALLLGLGIATKTHLLIALPFFFIYWKVNRYGWQRTFIFTGLTVITCLLVILPLLSSPGFLSSVFGTEEAYKLYLVHIPYLTYTQPPVQLMLLLAPLALVVLFLNFFAYKKLNKDAFLLILGLVFAIFLMLVPPMPGWFFWSIPFIVYFFAKYREIPRFSFWLMNLMYILYMILSVDSTVISSLQVIAPQLAASTPNVYAILSSIGFNAPLLVNLVFTLLVASVGVNAWWIYRIGVRSNLEYKLDDSPLVIGIGGDSGAGKNTLVNTLVLLLGQQHTVTMEGDDAHKWERNDEHWQQYTHLDPKSNKLHSELLQTLGLKSGQSIERSMYDHSTGRFTDANTVDARKNVIYVGLHPFYLSKMRQLFDIKIYVEPEESLRRHWKIMRDVQQRGKNKAEVLKQMEQRAGDAAKYIRPQRQFADLIVTFVPNGELIEGQPPKVKLRLTVDNSLPLDPILSGLARTPTMHVEHWYDEDLERQTVELDGMISAEEVRQLAYQLIPNVDELLEHVPTWQTDYDGLTQLLVAYHLSESQKSHDIRR